MTCEHEHEEEGVEVAESFTVDFCEHGYGHLALYRKGEERPFAIAYFGPGATVDMARVFAEAIVVEGHA